MDEKYNLDFCFKGDRTYIQGPDIFDAVVEKMNEVYNLNKITDIKYSAYEMLHKNAYLYFLDNFNKNDFNKINSVITFKILDKKVTAVVVENDNDIESSNEYSEEVVRTKSVINNKNIEFYNILEDSLTEIMVSMNKYFLQKTVTEDGKWIVTKFEYNNLIDINKIKNKKIKIELTNNFNNKLTKSTVMIDELLVGYLYFSLI